MFGKGHIRRGFEFIETHEVQLGVEIQVFQGGNPLDYRYGRDYLFLLSAVGPTLSEATVEGREINHCQTAALGLRFFLNDEGEEGMKSEA